MHFCHEEQYVYIYAYRRKQKKLKRPHVLSHMCRLFEIFYCCKFGLLYGMFLIRLERAKGEFFVWCMKTKGNAIVLRYTREIP